MERKETAIGCLLMAIGVGLIFASVVLMMQARDIDYDAQMAFDGQYIVLRTLAGLPAEYYALRGWGLGSLVSGSAFIIGAGVFLGLLS